MIALPTPPQLTNQAMAVHRRTGCDVESLKINYITPGEVNIPHSSTTFQYRKSNGYSPRNRIKPEEETHLPVPIDSVFPPPQNLLEDGSELSVGAPKTPVPRTAQTARRPAALDGFKLLEATEMGFPEDGRAATLSDQMLTSVVEDDLSFFTGLLKLDVSENRLKLNYFSCLPRLKELRIACNMIRGVDALSGFPRLQVLDFSYNALTLDGIRQLYALPALRELDLCGNELREIPDDFFRFACLEKVLLEHNMIKDNYVFDILGKVPRLRDVTLAYNALTAVPLRVTKDGNFKLLESLSLAFNFFGSDESVEAAVRLPRMLLLTLYGNPLLGPTGEDTSGAYVEDLYQLSEQLEKKQFPNRHLKILASIPRKLGAINHLKPKNTYEDIDLVKVPTSFEPKLNREYRQSGSETLFAAAYKKAKMSQLSSVPQDEDLGFPVSTTFLTTGYTGPEMAGVETIAGDVMDKVVASLGLNSATSLLEMQDAAASFIRLQVSDAETVPHDLFGRGIESGEQMNTQSTIRALKFALKHPLTNDRVVKMGNYARPTAATIGQRHQGKSNALAALETLLSNSHELADVTSPISRTAALDEGGLFSGKIRGASKANVNGATTNKLYSHGYSRDRTKKYRGIKSGGDVEGTPMNITLQQIEEVLDGLNDGEVGDVLLSEATGEHEYISPHSRAMRQSMKRMDRGIKKLIMTANAVATDIYD